MLRGEVSDMTKTYTKQSQTGEAGVALIGQIVTGMGFVWHPRRVDHGVDGEIELVDVVKRAPLNRVVFVQSKASTLPFPGEDEHGFHYDATPDDVEYWTQANAPVIVVCSHPPTREAWWAPASQAEPLGERRTRRIRFDKARDRLGDDSGPALLSLDSPASPGLSASPTARSERLVSNLLAVESLAPTIWMTPTWLRTPRDAVQILRSSGEHCNDWVLGDGMLFSFTRPDGSPLERLVDGAPEALDTSEWSESKDPDTRRQFVRLLNQVLVDSRSTALRRHPRGSLFFRPSKDLMPVRITVGRSARGRTVFERYTDRADHDRVRHYRHYSVKANFVRLDNHWFAELQPSYHYTFDGHREVPWSDELRKGIKRLEKNDAVRRLVEFWAAYLGPDTSLFGTNDDRLVFGDLRTFDVDRGIHDPAWRPPDPESPAPPGEGADGLW